MRDKSSSRKNIRAWPLFLLDMAGQLRICPSGCPGLEDNWLLVRAIDQRLILGLSGT